MESNLNILEAKVLEAIQRIKQLKQENQALQDRCEELEANCADFKATNERLTSELETVGQQASDLEDYEEKRKEVEAKVGGLLEQLEALG
jgi:chromosome segregation ATPase